MKRILLVALVLIGVVALLLGALYFFLNRGMPDNARAQLYKYLAYRYPLPFTPVIRETNRATRPWLFKAEQSAASYGDTIFYRTTVKYGNWAEQQVRVRSTAQARPGDSFGNDGLRSLPFPPEEAWCVDMDLGEQGSTVVLVALHQDLYSADWVIHELPAVWSETERAAALAGLGCALKSNKN